MSHVSYQNENLVKIKRGASSVIIHKSLNNKENKKYSWQRNKNITKQKKFIRHDFKHKLCPNIN